MSSADYEVVIIGGGPAGLTAGLYSARARLGALLIEKGLFGGQVVNAEVIENYPGFPDGIPGSELGRLMEEQAKKFGLKMLLAEVTGVELQGNSKLIKTSEGSFRTWALIIAGGSDRLKLGVPGEERFAGRGVSYCATCDGAFFRDMPVAVIGGGNSAVMEAIQLSKLASRVVVVHRRDQLRATKVVQEKAFAEPKIEFILNTVVDEIQGDDFVRSIKLHDVASGKQSMLDVSGVFVAVGLKPNTDYLKDLLKLDTFGYIVTNGNMETEVPGVYAAGDIRHDSGRQSVIAAGDGATAAIYAGRFLSA